MDTPRALVRFHELLLALLRVVIAVVMTRGHQNEYTIDQARGFLIEYRPLIVATFKRQANIGGLKIDDETNIRLLDEVVDCFVLLISLTDFLEVSHPVTSANFAY